jgi:hypothetical protein
MPFDKRRVEAVAMKIEEMSQQADPTALGWVGIDAVAAALAMSQGEIREFVDYLREMGWALPDYRKEPPQVRLTIYGREQIAKLRQPKLVRWMDSHQGIVSAIIAAVVSIFASLILGVIKYLVGLP